jgi:hypothetical protein
MNILFAILSRIGKQFGTEGLRLSLEESFQNYL